LNIQNFIQSIKENSVPSGMSLHLQALWHDGMGNWTKAHDLINHLHDKSAAHVHAYLHRKEGDIWNADYWYRKAGQKRPEVSLDEEWEQLLGLYL